MSIDNSVLVKCCNSADVFIREDDAGNETIAYIDDAIKELEQLDRDLGDEPNFDA